jgi:hypothetical protein
MTDTPMQPPPLDPLPERPKLRTLFETLLRRPQVLAAHLASGGPGATAKFGIITLLSFLLFGVVLGCFAKHEQLWAAPLKVSSGIFIAGAICFPSLYIFATLAGAQAGVAQMAALLGGALALSGTLLLGVAPAIWIFAESTDSFGFMGVLAIGAWLIALLFSIRFLRIAVTACGGISRGPMWVWSVVFLLVTLQMTTTLRPILGRSDRLFSHEKRFFLEHWLETSGRSLPRGVEETPAMTR